MFLTTQWTQVLAAGGEDTLAGEAMRDLCAAYYEPVVGWLRRSGRTDDDAREAAHGFFAELVSRRAISGADRTRGRFRSYLLGALKHHLARERQHAARLKRGGGDHAPQAVPAEDSGSGRAIADPGAMPPDIEFDRQWALQVLRRALTGLEQECASNGEAAGFAGLKPFLTAGESHGGLAALARETGEHEATVRSRLHRMRRRFRERVRSEVAATISSRADLDDELASLMAALRARPPAAP